MSLLRHSFANLLGGALPAVVMLVTTPYIVWKLGVVDYGLLTIISAIVGYFSIIDVNLTAGSIKYVAQYRAAGDVRRESQTIVLGLGIYFIIGLAGAAALHFFAQPLSTGVFSVPADRHAEAVRCLELAALGFLFGQLQQYLNSLPQAIQRFDISARLEALFGTLVPVFSVALLWLGAGLYELLQLRVVSSLVHALALAAGCRRLFPEFSFSLPDRALARTVMSFSGFAYLSKLASVTYAHADRLVIGALLGMEAVTLYSVPATLINRFMSLTFRLSSVVFPASSAMAERGDWSRLGTMYLEGSRYMLYLNGALILVTILFSKEILHYWIGPEIARQGWMVLSLMGLAMLLDSLTNIPSMVNDGLGHPRVSGMFAMARALVGLGFTWLAAMEFGIVGVAFAHLFASVLGAFAFLLYVHGRTVPFRLPDYLRQSLLAPSVVLMLLGGLGMALRPSHLLGIPATMAGAMLAMSLLALAGWFGVLSGNRRSLIADAMRQIRSNLLHGKEIA